MKTIKLDVGYDFCQNPLSNYYHFVKIICPQTTAISIVPNECLNHQQSSITISLMTLISVSNHCFTNPTMPLFPIMKFFSLCLLIIFPFFALSDPIYIDSIVPYFTINNLQLLDDNGSFLSSINGTFRASLVTTSIQPPRIYFSIVHVATQTVIWSANRNNPVSNSANLTLTIDGSPSPTSRKNSFGPRWY